MSNWVLFRRPVLPATMAAVAAWSVCAAQPEIEGPDAEMEHYLQSRGLPELLAEQLSHRVEAASGDEKTPLAERLAKVYVRLMSDAPTAEARRTWEARAYALLKSAPKAESLELRIDLARATYLPAEDLAERSRLRLAKPEELAETERVLRSVRGRFLDAASSAQRKVEGLEKLEQSGRATERDADELTEARRVRSNAYYYAGWSGYYLAMLTSNRNIALESLRDFGWLLGTPGGRAASVEKLAPEMLRYEHIARSAVGCALASSLAGNTTESVRWLDTVEEADAVPEPVRQQLLTRRIAVYAAGGRWADLQVLIRRTRKVDRRGAGPVEPLAVPAARLLSVLCFEADKRQAKEAIEGLARDALADLVTRGEVGQVLDLAERYGVLPIGDTGFAVNYVRGLLAYERARVAHRESGASPDEPAKSADIAMIFRESLALLDVSLRQPDSIQFSAERGRAMMSAAHAAFYSGAADDASDRFASLWADSTLPPEQRSEGLWLAVASLEHAAGDLSASPSIRTRIDQLIELYLREHPGSERAATLILRRGGAPGLDAEKAAETLLGVPRNSPIHTAARRQAAQLLYRAFRSAAPRDRDVAGDRFAAVAEGVLAIDRREAMDAAAAGGKQAAERCVVLIRQLLDALLGVSRPELSRAQDAMDALRAVAAYNALDLREISPELTYREVQIAMLRGAEADALAKADALAIASGASDVRFADAADRAVYRRAAELFTKNECDGLGAPGVVVRVGLRIVERLGDEREALKDPAVVSLFAQVARAAARLGTAGADRSMRELAQRLDRAVLTVQPGNAGALRRLAELSELSGEITHALECWGTLIDGTAVGSDAWCEARFNFLRLLAEREPARARSGLEQQRGMYPGYGPAPWGERFRALHDRLMTTPPSGGKGG
ncbi:MAG: hypothetical protein JNM07_05495 [Phycisphaerae bacterium]|nr:hypothetical protein [Phycisphaerae bacterium]